MKYKGEARGLRTGEYSAWHFDIRQQWEFVTNIVLERSREINAYDP